MFDVVVIGGGVVGACILRTLTRYDLKVCLVEKQADVSMGASRANSGVVHAGYDAMPGTLKAKFNVEGNRLMPVWAKELNVKYKNNGSLVVAFCDEDLETLHALKTRGEKNGVLGLEIISKERLFELEPNICKTAVGALYAPTGGIVCPYGLTVAAIGNAMDNGAGLLTNFEGASVDKTADGFKLISTNGQTVQARLVINAAGYNAGRVASAFGDDTVKIGGRKGEYILLDRESEGFVTRTLFCTPSKKGKGVLVLPTVDGNILLGPTATEVSDEDTTTTKDGLEEIITKAKTVCDNIPLYNAITSFSGIRAYSDRHDFIIEESTFTKGLINVAGIESPGLTSAPAIAEYVVNQLIAQHFELKENKNYSPYREKDSFFMGLTDEDKNTLIKENPEFGRIVCRCEQITEGEIVRAIHQNPPATTVDGVKRRLRAGMGRCQGGFCQPYITQILARELNKDLTEIEKSGAKSNLIVGDTK